MDLAQKQALKTHVLANTTVLTFGDGNASISSKFQSAGFDSGAGQTIADWYNLQASPDFFVWRDLPMDTVLGMITFKNMTPEESVPTSNLLDALLVWQARSNACQGQQMNLQNLILGRSQANMKNSNYRQGLNDALTNLPSGLGGATKSAGWTAVRDAAKFKANSFEKVFATGTGSTASPADLVLEGSVSGDLIYFLKDV